MSGLRTDWVVNWPTIISVASSAIVVSFWVYGSIKDLAADVRANKAASDIKFAEMDRLWVAQKATDDEQNARLIRSYNLLGDQIREMRQDLRADIRELRPAARVVSAERYDLRPTPPATKDYRAQ